MSSCLASQVKWLIRLFLVSGRVRKKTKFFHFDDEEGDDDEDEEDRDEYQPDSEPEEPGEEILTIYLLRKVPSH